jgi:hypothetical protein
MLTLAGQGLAGVQGAGIAVVTVLGRVFAFPGIGVAVVTFRTRVVVVTILIGFATARTQRIEPMLAPQGRVTPVCRAVVMVVAVHGAVHADPADRVAMVCRACVAVVAIPFPVETFAGIRVASVLGARIVVRAVFFLVHAPHVRVAEIIGALVLVIAVLLLEIAFTGRRIALTIQTFIQRIAAFYLFMHA